MEKKIGKIMYIWLADDEWNNATMERVACEAFAANPTLDAVHVTEHAGWFLEYAPSKASEELHGNLLIIGTANDMAHLSEKAKAYLAQFEKWEHAGSIRRQSHLVEIMPGVVQVIVDENLGENLLNLLGD